MSKVETSIIINRPLEEVFAYLSDLRNASQWQSGVLEVRQTPESPVGIGTKVTLVRKFLGRKVGMTSEIVEYEPNMKLTFKSTSGPVPNEGSYLFESTVEGTKFTARIEVQPGGFFALAEPVFARMLSRNLEAALGDAKDLLESQAVVASS